MTTTIYQKFVSRLNTTITLVNIDYGDDEYMELLPYEITKKLSPMERVELMSELIFWQNEKANWESDEF